jgi:hypothetical protein
VKLRVRVIIVKENQDYLHSLKKAGRCLPLSIVVIMLLVFATPVIALTSAASNGITGPKDAAFRAGLWWDPSSNGSGWEINQSGDAFFAIWYTYDVDGNPVWYTTNGPFADGQYSGDLLQFSWDYNDQLVNTPVVAGNVTIDFFNPQLAEISWRLGDQQNSYTVRPFIFSGSPAMADHSGSWFDPQESGYGMTIQSQGDLTYAVLYYYDEAGKPTWSAGINAEDDQSLSLLNFKGSCPWCEYSTPTYVPAGELSAQFQSETRLILQLSLPDAAPFWSKPQAQQVMISNAPSGRVHPAAMASIASDEALRHYFKAGYVQGNGYDYSMLCLPPIVSPAPPVEPLPQTEVISSTNVQVAGVDEADVVKATSQYLYSLNLAKNEMSLSGDIPSSRQSITRYRISADGETPVGDGMFSVSLPAAAGSNSFVQSQGLYHYEPLIDFGNLKLIYVASQVQGGCMQPAKGSTSIVAFNAESNTDFNPINQLQVDGELISSRKIGDRLFLATTFRPDIYSLAAKVLSPQEASEFSPTPDGIEALFSMLTPADLFPAVTYPDGSSQPLVTTDNVMMPSLPLYDIKPVLTTLSMFDLNDLDALPVSISIMGRTNGMYATPDSVFLASSHTGYELNGLGELVRTGFIDTDIHKIAIENGVFVYRGSGTVAGSLGNDTERLAFRMSEYQDHLRVVSSSSWGDRWGELGYNRLTILKESENNKLLLTTVSVLPNAGRPEPIGKPGESIYGVRFKGERGYVVTFVRVDPLYSLDLSDPTDPLILGELEIEGFSDYLHPVGDDLLVGVGMQAETDEDLGNTWFQGVQVGLFDVSSPSAPVLLNLEEIGYRGTTTTVLDTHRAFTFIPGDPEREIPMRFTIPVSEHGPLDGVPDPDPSFWYPWKATGIVMFEINELSGGFSTMEQVGRTNLASVETIEPEFADFYQYPQEEYSRSVIYGDQVLHYFRGGLFQTQWRGSKFTPAENCPLCAPKGYPLNP